jgi:protein HOOK3
VEEFQLRAAEAVKLKDQLDEWVARWCLGCEGAEIRYRHVADKLQKSENVIEKYKKKLEDSAGLRRELKSLEEENAALINTNATLETELKTAGSAKTLVDSYKAQIATLEAKAAAQADEVCVAQLYAENPLIGRSLNLPFNWKQHTPCWQRRRKRMRRTSKSYSCTKIRRRRRSWEKVPR